MAGNNKRKGAREMAVNSAGVAQATWPARIENLRVRWPATKEETALRELAQVRWPATKRWLVRR